MSRKTIQIKEGIDLHVINTNKFKTNVMAIFLTTKLTRENVTKEALIPAVLRLGNNQIKTQKELNQKLEEMYGAGFNCGIEKRGDNHVLKFYIQSVNDEYLLNKEKIFLQSLNLLVDIVFNPLVENGAFNKKYVEGEKENLKRIIEGSRDNKASYAYSRCIEEMYKNDPYGLYEYGYLEDLLGIDETNLYKYYEELIQKCKIDIFVSGKFDNENEITEGLNKNESFEKLSARQAEFVGNSKQVVGDVEIKEEKESMDVAQGKIVIGLSIKNGEKLKEEAINLYNAILGGGANSKMFQNVREKASLAYTAGSRYLKVKNNIFINCGIDINNYEKALAIIKEQLEDMEKGNFSIEDINNAKELLLSSLNSLEDEQINEISYYLTKELLNDNKTIEETEKNIKAVQKDEIIEVAKLIRINTIFTLYNEGGGLNEGN